MSGTAHAENSVELQPTQAPPGDLLTKHELRAVGPDFVPTDFVPAKHLTRTPPSVKRHIDVVLALLLGVGAIPLGLAIAAAIKLTSRGPVFFRQKRVGRYGETFEIVKFRTMRPGTHEEVMQSPLEKKRYEANGFKMPEDDPRITAIGRLLRKTSLDELPQLLNVLRGDMSLVGIRPLLEDELAQRPVYDQRCYTLLPPGMTGLWQVSGRSTINTDLRLSLDRHYVEYWSLLGDLRILFRTPSAVLSTHNAK